MREDTTITVPELRRLVIDICNSEPPVSIRYRLMGAMWHHNFVRIKRVDESGMTLIDEQTEQEVTISNLATVVQFELDRAFRSFEAHYPYTVGQRLFWLDISPPVHAT